MSPDSGILDSKLKILQIIILTKAFISEVMNTSTESTGEENSSPVKPRSPPPPRDDGPLAPVNGQGSLRNDNTPDLTEQIFRSDKFFIMASSGVTSLRMNLFEFKPSIGRLDKFDQC